MARNSLATEDQARVPRRVSAASSAHIPAPMYWTRLRLRRQRRWYCERCLATASVPQGLKPQSPLCSTLAANTRAASNCGTRRRDDCELYAIRSATCRSTSSAQRHARSVLAGWPMPGRESERSATRPAKVATPRSSSATSGSPPCWRRPAETLLRHRRCSRRSTDWSGRPGTRTWRSRPTAAHSRPFAPPSGLNDSKSHRASERASPMLRSSRSSRRCSTAVHLSAGSAPRTTRWRRRAHPRAPRGPPSRSRSGPGSTR